MIWLKEIILAGFIVIRDWLRFKRAKIGKKDPIATQIDRNNLVKAWLRRLYESLSFKPTSIRIFLFHNGGSFYSGSSMQKMSLFAEEGTSMFRSMLPDLQNLPIMSYHTVLSNLIDANSVSFEETDNIDDSRFRHFLEFEHIKSLYAFSVKDQLGRFVGLLTIQYSGHPHKMTSGELAHISLQCDTIRDNLVL
jgi:hypothetical protein